MAVKIYEPKMNTVLELDDQARSDLRHYARLMKRYLDPEIFNYGTFGFKTIPKNDRLRAKRIEFGMESYEDDYGISGKWGTGLWQLSMVGANENPGSSYCDDGYWWILPLKSDNRVCLDFLADEALPRVFDKEFHVNSTMIPTNGDCSWDCM